MYAHVTALARSGNPQLKYTAGQMPDLQNRMGVNNREMKRGEPVCWYPPLGSMHFVFLRRVTREEQNFKLRSTLFSQCEF